MADGTLFKILSVCKGGGYRYCRTDPPHPKRNAKGLYPLHRVTMENIVGRLLRSDEHVHHINGDKNDDSPLNLELLSVAEHSRRHRPLMQAASFMCPHCGDVVDVKPHVLRQRVSRSKHGQPFCSLRCSGLGARSKA